jgi:hypothetical protein
MILSIERLPSQPTLAASSADKYLIGFLSDAMFEIRLQEEDRLRCVMFPAKSPSVLAVDAVRNDWEFEAATRRDTAATLNIETRTYRN